MKIEVLVSTMNRTDLNLYKEMNIRTDAIIINQCNKNEERETIENNQNIKMISYKERGLSKSRNRAISNSRGDILVIADDDVVYDDDYKEKILSAYNKYKDADIIAFQVERTTNRYNKKFSNKHKYINYISSRRISSVELTMKRKSIVENNINFNELFGAGSKYFLGEENIFLYECIKKGLNIVYVPVKIAIVHDEDSTWFRGYTKEYFISKGACDYAMSKKFFRLLSLQFLIRKYNLYKKDISFYNALKFMKIGSKEYKKILESE